MSTAPVVSIIMPVYNVEAFVTEAIESILGQSFREFELLIIDDGSSDGTVGMVERFADERIVLFKKNVNTGLVDSLNFGLDQARGEFIARMDGDDISDIFRLEKQLAYLRQHPEVAICGCAYRIIGDDRTVCFPAPHEEIKLCLLDYCPLAHPTMFIRRSFIVTHNLRYNAEFICAEDYELWTRCIWLGKMANLTDVLLSYRLHPHQASNTGRSVQIQNSDICRVHMLSRVWPQASLTDILTRALLFQDIALKNLEELGAVVEGLTNLITKNKSGPYYEPRLFSNYVAIKRRNIIRRFFLTIPVYTPTLFFKLISGKNNYRQYFTNFEYLKLALKCLVFHKLKPAAE